jgi:hypothetical protein
MRRTEPRAYRAVFLALAWAMPGLAGERTAAPAPRSVEWRVAPGLWWLGGTPYLHGFGESTQLDEVSPRLLFSLSADVASFDGRLGAAWLGLTYALATPWTVTVVDKYGGAPPERLETATVHLLVVKGPAPRLRLRAGDVSFFAQATLGVRTGLVVQGTTAVFPIELMLCAAGGVDYPLAPDRWVGLSVEVLHSLATGWVTGLVAVHVRGWR